VPIKAVLNAQTQERMFSISDKDQMLHLFCFGYGLCASTLRQRLTGSNWQVSATYRTAEDRLRLTGANVNPHLFTDEHGLENAESVLGSVSHILISIPPQGEGDVVVKHHGAEIAAAASHIEWIGYLSTTGVYGDRQGAWVDERDPPAPTNERGVRRLAAEEAWEALGRQAKISVMRFRLAGIYGPGRNQLIGVGAGSARRIEKTGQVFCRIHVDDIASVLQATMAKPQGGQVYNVADDLPAPPGDVIAFAADLLGLAPPPLIPFEEADLSPMGRSFYEENKRVRNDLIKETLGVNLAHPTYREGLRALFDAGEGQDTARA